MYLPFSTLHLLLQINAQCPKRCSMFWNVCKNNFPNIFYFFRLTKFAFQVSGTKRLSGVNQPYHTILPSESILKKQQENRNLTYCCPRDIFHLASLEPNYGPPWNPSDHHSIIVLRGWRGPLSAPLCAERRWSLGHAACKFIFLNF